MGQAGAILRALRPFLPNFGVKFQTKAETEAFFLFHEPGGEKLQDPSTKLQIRGHTLNVVTSEMTL